MKKLLLTTLLFCGLVFSSQSQTLQFSQVLLASSLDTVPQGKVWKITAYLPNVDYYPTVTNGGVIRSEIRMKVNGESCVLAAAMQGNYSSASSHVFPMPIWLPAGTTLEPSTNCGSLSVIEFTVN